MSEQNKERVALQGLSDEQILEIGRQYFRSGHDPKAEPAFVKAVRAILAASPTHASAAQCQMPDMLSSVINDACWKFIEAMPHQLPGPIFNDLKPALYEAVCYVLRETKPATGADASLDFPRTFSGDELKAAMCFDTPPCAGVAMPLGSKERP